MVQGVTTVGIQELNETCDLVAAGAHGETVTVSDPGGMPLVQITAVPERVDESTATPKDRLEVLVAAGFIRPSTHDPADLPMPKPGPISLSAALPEMRNEKPC